jgi:Spy/CpxP family protein refolding chaperone
MKKTSTITLALLAGILMISSAAFGQRGQGMMGQGRMSNAPMGWGQGRMGGGPMWMGQRCQMIPDLTQEQQSQIKELRVEQMKQMTTHRNNLLEKRAQLRNLQIADNPDMDAINGLIEEMGDIRTNMQKNRAQHRQEIRQILNEEQRAFFDSRRMHSRKSYHRNFNRRGGGRW